MTALIVILGILQAWDAYVTIPRLLAGAKESNPILEVFVELFGIYGGVILPKVAVMAALIYYSVPAWALGVCVAWYLYWAARGFKINKKASHDTRGNQS